MNIKPATVILFLLTLASSSVFAASTLQYQVIDLGTLGGSSSRAYGISNFGDVVGRARTEKLPDGNNGPRNTFLYTNGTMHDLGNLGGSITYGYDINDSRQVVGRARMPESSDYHAFVYERGTLKDLGTLGSGKQSYAWGINTSGQVVGWGHTNESGTTARAFLYDNGTMTELGTLGGGHSSAFDINDEGLIVGTSTTAGPSEIRAVSFSNNQITDLGSLDGTGYSEARAVNDNGQIVAA